MTWICFLSNSRHPLRRNLNFLIQIEQTLSEIVRRTVHVCEAENSEIFKVKQPFFVCLELRCFF